MCAWMGCGHQIRSGFVYCDEHQSRKLRRERIPESGPSGKDDLDISLVRQPAGRGFSACAHEDCGQPCIRGRLYCSDRCRRRARKDPAQFTIDGVTASLPEHARARDIDLSTVYCRMRTGMSPVEAVLAAVDEMQRYRRTGHAAA